MPQTALSLGSQVTSLLGILGFLVACVYSYLVIRGRSEIQRLKLLPEDKRAKQADELLTRYGLSLENVGSRDRVDLVHRELNLRFRSRLIFLIIGAVVFLVCFYLLASGHTGTEPPKYNPVEQQVRDARDNISQLRGTFESADENPSAYERVRRKGIELAEILEPVNDERLRLGLQIQKYEYLGWALSMVARSYEPVEDVARVQRYSAEAIAALKKSVSLMEKVRSDFSNGSNDAVDLHKWLIESETYNRTYYLLAIATAVNISAGGTHNREDVVSILNRIGDAYLETYPITANPHLRALLSDS